MPRPRPVLSGSDSLATAPAFSLSRCLLAAEPWHLAAGHATACPVHKTKHGCCALLFSCPCAVVATWGQLLPCSRMLYISFVSLSAVSAVSAVSVAVFAVLFTISNRMSVLPYPVSRIPYPAMPYAVSRFLIYAIPCMCHISAAKHAAHACGAWQQQKYHKKCHKRSTWNMWHAARTLLRVLSLNLQQRRCEAALDKPRQAVAHNSCHLPLATAMKWQLAAAPCLVARQKPLCKRKHQIVN